MVTSGFGLIGLGIVVLTYLGYKDTPAHPDPAHWTPLAVAGREIADDQRCVTCHRDGAAANPVSRMRVTHDPEWLFSHVKDPQVIAPGLREPPEGGMSDSQAWSILALIKKVRAGAPPPPAMPVEERTAVRVLGRYCAACHMIDGEGASSAPDLTRAGEMNDAMTLRDWITSPEDVDGNASMPPFGGTLSDEEMTAIVNYLAARK
jgi:mono/diheme cytochrome c family protein